jgi:hypothetical protein
MLLLSLQLKTTATGMERPHIAWVPALPVTLRDFGITAATAIAAGLGSRYTAVKSRFSGMAMVRFSWFHLLFSRKTTKD